MSSSFVLVFVSLLSLKENSRNKIMPLPSYRIPPHLLHTLVEHQWFLKPEEKRFFR